MPATSNPATSTLDAFPAGASLHPDCPDWRSMGPTTADAGIRAMAAEHERREAGREQAWSKGFTRRRVLQGGLGVGVAAASQQLVTTRVAYGAGTATGTLVVVFLRGGMDGLSMLVPAEDPALLAARPGIAVRGSQLIQFNRGFGLHPGLAPLQPLIAAGKLAAVPAISTPFLTRSHFQAQDCLERGGMSGASSSAGWLDRLLSVLGPGTTFRSIGGGASTPRSLLGAGAPVMMNSLESFAIEGVWPDVAPATMRALRTLYTGVDHPMARQTMLALTAADTVGGLNAAEATPVARGYSDDTWGNALGALGSMIRTRQGVRVATVDLGGWDMHTQLGTAADGDFLRMSSALAKGLATFMTDLGAAAATTTVVVMSEFGRRVEQNASGGVDHGHGGVAMVLGGGVSGGVKGTWAGLAAQSLDQGDVPGSNDYRDLLAEVVMKRFGLTPADIAPVFPGWAPKALGVMA